MKKFIVVFTIITTLFALGAQAQNSCKKQSIEQLANNFAQAFQDKKLGQIDATRPFVDKITVRIENSLSGDGEADQFKYKQVKTFALLEKWLKGREVEGLPNRSIEPLIKCKNGICTYDLKGLLHNTLFLQKISFAYKKDKCPYIKSIFLVDGN